MPGRWHVARRWWRWPIDAVRWHSCLFFIITKIISKCWRQCIPGIPVPYLVSNPQDSPRWHAIFSDHVHVRLKVRFSVGWLVGFFRVHVRRKVPQSVGWLWACWSLRKRLAVHISPRPIISMHVPGMCLAYFLALIQVSWTEWWQLNHVHMVLPLHPTNVFLDQCQLYHVDLVSYI